MEKLLAAARNLLDGSAYEDLTLRIVAAEAGVSAATAYTYFSSKDHLFAVLFWRHVADAELPDVQGDPVDRLQQTVRHLSDLIAASPAVAAAATKSLLVADPDVQTLRITIGRHWLDLFSAALGDEVDPVLLRTLGYTFSGALLEAGMGLFDYEALGAELESVIALVMRGNI